MIKKERGPEKLSQLMASPTIKGMKGDLIDMQPVLSSFSLGPQANQSISDNLNLFTLSFPTGFAIVCTK